ncbi:MAG: LacI family DNA-binding transcriptional regulator [Planctomycetes bacterium]|nr:LacI family DNA-binding transcriptional regulator [Planctomycetota bacterium]
MEITLDRLAQKFNIHRSTVSRALSGITGVSPELRDKIIKEAEEMNYQPHAIGRALATKKTNTIGLIVPCVWNPLCGEIIHHLEVYAHLKYFNVMLSVTGYDETEEINALRTLMYRQVDAVLILTNYEFGKDKLFLEFKESSIPFVVIGYSAPANINYVAVDRETGVNMAVEHLTNLGHKRIASVGLIMKSYDHKFIGYKKALEKEGLEIRNDFIVTCEASFETGYNSAKKILKLTPCPTAVFAASDVIAIGLINGFKEMGVRVPEDIAVVGFDDIEVAAYAGVPLTTIHQPKEEMAKIAIDIVSEYLRCVEEEARVPLVRQNLVEPKLVIRDSCGMKLQQRNIVLQPRLIVRESTGHCRMKDRSE